MAGLFPDARTLPLWKWLLVRAFGERHEHVDFDAPDGSIVITVAYVWRGLIYVAEREVLFERRRYRGARR